MARSSVPGSGRSFLERHRVVVGAAASVTAAALGVVWLVVVPEKADTTTGLQSLAIRYGHPLCWVLLACAAASYAAEAPRRVTDSLAWSGLGTYAAFLGALVL